jgi:chromosome segregation ATPase
MRTLLLAVLAAGVAARYEGVQNPLRKVTDLLENMLQVLDEERQKDEALYNKHTCWCATNLKEKQAAIADGEARLNVLVTQLDEATALAEKLKKEIKDIDGQVKGNVGDRNKDWETQNAGFEDFSQEEKELMQSISQLKGAIAVLKKHNSLVDLSGVIRDGLSRGYTGRDAAEFSWLQGLASAPAGYKSYANQSGQIFGVLQSMLDTFEKNLGDSAKAFMAQKEAHDKAREANDKMIKSGEELRDSKAAKLAETEQAKVDAEEDIKDTRKNLDADRAFLDEMTVQCRNIDAEYRLRVKNRDEEQKAVQKALSMLTSPEAQELIYKTMNKQSASLLQEGSTRQRRDEAARILSAVGSPKLSALAVQVRLDAFTKVKKAIDQMIADLQEEMSNEVKHKDYCVASLAENAKNDALKVDEKERLDSQIAVLGSEIETLEEEMKVLTDEIAEMQKQVKRAGDNRSKEQLEFDANMKDQQATLKLLQAVHQVLKEFYSKEHEGIEDKTELVQQDPRPEGFAPLRKNAGAGGVLSMIETVMNDVKKAEAELLTAENDSQRAYEEFVRDSNTSIEQKTRSIQKKTATQARKKEEKINKETASKDAQAELDELATEAADLHKECDFTLKNFDIRQQARNEEINALRQAKSILSGAKFNAFLQRH